MFVCVCVRVCVLIHMEYTVTRLDICGRKNCITCPLNCFFFGVFSSLKRQGHL
jgi:hypothetical protein